MKKKHTIIKHKKTKPKIQKGKTKKRRKTYKIGGSAIYDMDTGTIIKTDLTYDGNPFFRKQYPKLIGKKDVRHIEKQIVEILMMNPHPNIVTFYVVNDEYLDMEELDTLNTATFNSNKPEIISVMREVKDFLQHLGIMYIDWKFDNIGKGKDGNYKLFDFDASGIINLVNQNEWIVTPPNFWSFRNATKHNCETPKQKDDWSFEYNILENPSIIC